MHKPTYLLLYLLLIGMGTGCTEPDEKNYDQAILGVWYQSSPFPDDANRSYRNEYHFKNDGTFEYSLGVIDSGGNEPMELGYMSWHKGSFQVVESTLLLQEVEYYGLDNQNEILPKEQLILHNSGHDTETFISFNKKWDKLTMEKACPEDAICAGAQTYYKEN